jgi:hypothetical protein
MTSAPSTITTCSAIQPAVQRWRTAGMTSDIVHPPPLPAHLDDRDRKDDDEQDP